MKIQHSITVLSCSIAALALCDCRRDEAKAPDPKLVSLPKVLTVNEARSVNRESQNYGQRMRVRGWLNAVHQGEYSLFYSEWDPFEREAGEKIPRIELRFRDGQVPDDRLGNFLDVTATLTTIPNDDGGTSVILADAVMEASRAE